MLITSYPHAWMRKWIKLLYYSSSDKKKFWTVNIPSYLSRVWLLKTSHHHYVGAFRSDLIDSLTGTYYPCPVVTHLHQTSSDCRKTSFKIELFTWMENNLFCWAFARWDTKSALWFESHLLCMGILTLLPTFSQHNNKYSSLQCSIL